MDFIIIQDTDIIAVNREQKENESGSIVYRDQSGLLHKIDFHTCALNYLAEHNNASVNCIGKRNITEAYFLFYTSGIKTKILFKKHYVLNLFCHHVLKGSKTFRFQSLQKLICETNYKTYDLS